MERIGRRRVKRPIVGDPSVDQTLLAYTTLQASEGSGARPNGRHGVDPRHRGGDDLDTGVARARAPNGVGGVRRLVRR
jgi:hypothetical protein